MPVVRGEQGARPTASPSPYFDGPKPAANAKVQVRAHSRAAPQKRVPLPPSLDPAADHRFDPPPHHAPVPTAPPVNTQRLEPAHKAPSARESYKPFYAGQKPTRYETQYAPIPTLASGKPMPKQRTVKVPVYTLGKAGKSGQQGLLGVGGRVVTPEQAQAQLGTTPTTAMALLNSTVHPLTDLSRQATGEKPFHLGGAASDVANIASNLIPAGKVGAAGLFGLRGLKGLRDAKAGVDAIEAAKEVASVAPAEAQDVLRGTFKGARGVRGKQEAGYSAERAQRAQAANVHLTNQALPPDERLRLAKQELKGELPKIDFQGMKVLDDQALTKLQAHILDHPHLMPFQKINASTALANAVAGKVPTKSELTLLEHVFGKPTADSLGQIHNHPLKDTILSVLNVPRSLMASYDFSAPFRQGLVVSVRHPTIFARNLRPMLKAFGSEKVYHAMLDEIHTRPTYPMMMEAKLSLTELSSKIGAREEQFASDLAEKIPVAGRGVRMSARAYTGFLDKTRADVFDHLLGRAQAQGVNVQDPEFLKNLGRYINSATGRGPLTKNLEGAAPALNAVFFSPRLLASRLDLIFSPITYARTDPFVRREALKSMIAMAGTLSTLLAVAAQAPGVKVVLDPRNPDWGKIRVGNTRVDIGGGFQQPLRLFAQLATGVAISSTTGKKLNLTAGGFGQPNRLDLLLRFFEGKESPIASLVTDWMRNSNQVGQKFTWRAEVAQRLIPLLVQDSYDLYKASHGGMNGIAAAFAGYGIGSVGFGIQNYGPRPPTATTKPPQSYFGSSGSSGGSPYFGSPSSSGGGGGYFK